jgi:hypothetical protein
LIASMQRTASKEPSSKREHLTRVCSREARLVLETCFAREPVSVPHGLVEELDTNDLASRQLGKVQGGAAGPAGHV